MLMKTTDPDGKPLWINAAQVCTVTNASDTVTKVTFEENFSVLVRQPMDSLAAALNQALR